MNEEDQKWVDEHLGEEEEKSSEKPTKKREKLPEAGAVAFFSYKRTDGFEISLTLRDESGLAVLQRIDKAIEQIKEQGGIPTPKSGYAKAAPVQKPIEFVPDRACPKCGNKLLYGTSKDGRRFIKCETSKYDFKTKQATGCTFFEWSQ